MEINLEDLRLIINKIFDQLDTENCKTITLSEVDDYWDIADEDKFDLTKKPNNLGIGKLSDDLEFLLPILEYNYQASNTFLFMLHRYSNI